MPSNVHVHVYCSSLVSWPHPLHPSTWPHPWFLPLAGSDARTVSGCAVGRIEVREETLSELLRLYLTEISELEEVREGQEERRRTGGEGVGQEERRRMGGEGVGQEERRRTGGEGVGQEERRRTGGEGVG